MRAQEAVEMQAPKSIGIRKGDTPIGLSIEITYPREDNFVFTARVKGERVGYAELEFGGFRPRRCPSDAAGLLQVEVRRSYRRRGIGGELIDAALAYAKSKGFMRMVLEVFPVNEDTIRLYEAKGFVNMEGNPIGINGGPLMIYGGNTRICKHTQLDFFRNERKIRVETWFPSHRWDQ